MSIIKIYCDESRQTNSKYKLMGSIWIKKEFGWPFINEFYNLCLSHTNAIPGHMKWTNIPNNIYGKYFEHYKILIDLYFKYNEEDKMFFKTIIADEKYNFHNKNYNDGDYEVGFYKLYYLMILNSLNINDKYHIRIADRNVTKKQNNLDQQDRLDELMKCLNNGFIKKHGYRFINDPILTIEPRVAKERKLIQLADILMGAVGYHWNGLHLLPQAKESKVYLSNYIANKLGRNDLCFTTYASDKKFNIFKLNI